jgi:hypothetical protein
MIRSLLSVVVAPRRRAISSFPPSALVITSRKSVPCCCVAYGRAAAASSSCFRQACSGFGITSSSTAPRIRPYSIDAGSESDDDTTTASISTSSNSNNNNYYHNDNEDDDHSPPTLPRRKTKTEREKLLESLPVTYADISRANVAIRNGVKRTPCIKSYYLSELLGANIFLKMEFQQFTGSFKERGARNAILTLLRELGQEKLQQTGVIAASAGNHALALAYHGKDLGVPVTVVMPTVAPLAKVDKCRVSIYIYFLSSLI